MNWTKFFRKLGVFLMFAVCVWQLWPLGVLIVDAVVNGILKKGDYILKDWTNILVDFDIDINPKDLE